MGPRRNDLDPNEVLKGFPKFKFVVFIVIAIAIVLFGLKYSLDPWMIAVAVVCVLLVGAQVSGKLDFHIINDDY